MCGGSIKIYGNESAAECEYCNSIQTIPKITDDISVNLYNRANNLRLKNEFDKAAQIYEKIVEQNDSDPEAYWGLVLCKYGIEYVEDPKTHKRIPTCHRTLYDAITSDVDYLAAVKHADIDQKKIYEDEARSIDSIQKNILAIVKNEKPFDVFICYKQSDENGNRTIDSTIANDIYYQLTNEGFNVFYAAITLEDKLGTEYEPYIFAALSTSKVMLVVGTKPEYFNAVWVKNEWSRFMKLMKGDKTKLLIPCYRDMDAYELPEDFSHLQAQDMSKIGFISDIVRGIKKVIVKEEKPQQVKETIIVNNGGEGGASVASLVKRGKFALEDREFDKAKDFFERALDIDAECAEAYFGIGMIELKASDVENFKNGYMNLRNNYQQNKNIKRAFQFATGELKSMFEKLAEERRIAEEKAAEERRIAEEKAAEERRIAEEKARLALYDKAKTAEERRIAEEKARLVLYEKKINEFNEFKKMELLTTGAQHTVGIKTDGTVVAVGRNDYSQLNVNEWRDIISVSAGRHHTVGLKLNKTVVSTLKSEDISNWKSINKIVAGAWHTIGLDESGKVFASGVNKDGQCNVEGWQDISDIFTSDYHTVGLKKDGTVVATGWNEYGQCDVSDWRDIVDISVGEFHTVGLKSDGTVVAVGKNDHGQCDVGSWHDIISIIAEGYHTAGLTSRGEVSVTNNMRCCSGGEWLGLVSIALCADNIVGLKPDRTVIIGHLDVNETSDETLNSKSEKWSDIISIISGKYHIVGLKSDGRVVALGWNEYNQCDVSKWKLFDNISNIEAEKVEAKKKLEESDRKKAEELRRKKEEAEILKMKKAEELQIKIAEENAKRDAEEKKKIYRNKNLCQHCGGKFKGLFSKVCSVCGELKDY